MKCSHLFFSSSHTFFHLHIYFFYCQETGEKKHMKKKGDNAEKRKRSLNWRRIITQSSKSNWENINYTAPNCSKNKYLLHCHFSHKPEQGDGISDSKSCLLVAVATKKLFTLDELELSCFATVSPEIPPWSGRKNVSNCFSLTPQNANRSNPSFSELKGRSLTESILIFLLLTNEWNWLGCFVWTQYIDLKL